MLILSGIGLMAIVLGAYIGTSSGTQLLALKRSPPSSHSFLSGSDFSSRIVSSSSTQNSLRVAIRSVLWKVDYEDMYGTASPYFFLLRIVSLASVRTPIY
jgi:hypothetical protein